MNLHDLFNTLILGVIEGLTEFLPVSSTGHMLLADHFLGINNNSGVFEVVIQLGAILSVLVVYFERLWKVAAAAPKDAGARRFIASVLLAFMPAAVLGALLHKKIKEVFFGDLQMIAVSLILGGIVFLVVEKLPKRERVDRAERVPYATAFGIGLFQALAMIPGVSRSGATIIGAMLLGVERKAAAEFSFFLAISTMVAACGYDLLKNFSALSGGDLEAIAIGFVVSFIVALAVVRGFIGFIGRYGFVPFGWYRIVLGVAVLVALHYGM